MRSASKQILFSRVTVGNKTVQWPTGVFANDKSAKAFGSLLNIAHKTGNVDLAKSLDPKTHLTGDGKLTPGIKFSLLEVPYEPSAASDDDDPFGDDSSPTA
jgi:hypothetical protein